MENYEEKVKRLSENWEPFATVIEQKITEGWGNKLEPPKLVRDISAYMNGHDPIKGAKFDKKFFSHLD